MVHPDRDTRQRGIVPAERLNQLHVLVVGVGAIGRQVALQLASLGMSRMTLMDHDLVRVENLAVQGYWPSDLHQPKVEVTGALCQRIHPDLLLTKTAERFRRHPGWEADVGRTPVVMVCVDSINTRRIISETLQCHVDLLIDGRMHAEVMRIVCQDHQTDQDRYLQTLFAESEAFVGSCTARSTIYTASIAAGLMVSQLVRWLRHMPVIPDQTLNLLSCDLIIPE